MSALWAALPFVALAIAVPVAARWEHRERERQYVSVEIVADLDTYTEAMERVRLAFEDLGREVMSGFMPAMIKIAEAQSRMMRKP